jgi:hypothetical protein
MTQYILPIYFYSILICEILIDFKPTSLYNLFITKFNVNHSIEFNKHVILYKINGQFLKNNQVLGTCVQVNHVFSVVGLHMDMNTGKPNKLLCLGMEKIYCPYEVDLGII